MVDVIMFAGQSNMAGRGIVCEKWPQEAPEATEGSGYEYRAITAPNALYPVVEPFGVNENTEDGINDGKMKTGSLVSAFINAYYEQNGHIQVVGISASKGGSSIGQWQMDSKEGYLKDAIKRLSGCIEYLNTQKLEIRNTFLVWCQGETDGDIGTSEKEYKEQTRNTFDAFKEAGISHVFTISIGKCNKPGHLEDYDEVIKWQKDIAEDDDVTMISSEFVTMRDEGLMKDDFHYYQAGYNRCGAVAGSNLARWTAIGR